MEDIKIKEKGKNVFFSVSLLQSILAILLILCILAVKFFFKEQYIGLKKWYISNMTVDTDVSEIIKGSNDEV